MGHLPAFGDAKMSQDQELFCGVGRLVCAWGVLEQCLEQKIAELRQAAGDVRTIGARTKPTMAKLMGELRAMISMRDRRNAQILTEIAELERDMQRIDRFRGLIISGFQALEPGGFTCRDMKNNVLHVSFDQLGDEIGRLENIAGRLLAL